MASFVDYAHVRATLLDDCAFIAQEANVPHHGAGEVDTPALAKSPSSNPLLPPEDLPGLVSDTETSSDSVDSSYSADGDGEAAEICEHTNAAPYALPRDDDSDTPTSFQHSGIMSNAPDSDSALCASFASVDQTAAYTNGRYPVPLRQDGFAVGVELLTDLRIVANPGDAGTVYPAKLRLASPSGMSNKANREISPAMAMWLQDDSDALQYRLRCANSPWRTSSWL